MTKMLGQAKNGNHMKDKLGDRGFTLTELMVALIIIGVIAAISTPHFLGLLDRYRVAGALQQLLGAVNETQRLAMVRGKSCRISVNLTTKKITANPTGCILGDRSIDSAITMRSNFPGSTNITFSYKGSNTRMGTIVLSSAHTNVQKYFVIALGTGIKRTGDYNGSKTGAVDRSKCKTTE
jgi:prepilin-type N-terminal cleavage/methylation domain-containing protein